MLVCFNWNVLAIQIFNNECDISSVSFHFLQNSLSDYLEVHHLLQ